MDVSLFEGVNRIVTHGNCPDGMGSAVILRCVFPGIEPEFYHHKQPEYLNLVPEEGMLFCDITPPEHRAEDFVSVNPIVLDHHKGVEHIVGLYGERGVFADESKEPGVSGTTLAFREILEPYIRKVFTKLQNPQKALQKAGEFARLAGVRDTWQKQDPDWESACHQAAMLTFYPWEHWADRAASEMFNPYYSQAFSDEMDVGQNIYAKRMKDATKCIKNSIVFKSCGYKVAVFNDPDRLCSDVAEMHRQNGVDVVAGFYYVDDGEGPNIIYSIRCNEKFNVQTMASSLGGGGHSKAAGFSVTTQIQDINPFLRFKELFDKFVENNGCARL
jgi:oligoribonuclease NrnB/cAMP/cGMP phosphodiesterase (DHH superfamily)